MLTFLIGTFIAGCFIEKFLRILIVFLKGALGVLPAVLLIMFAGSIKLIMQNSQIEATIFNALADKMKQLSKIEAALVLYALIFGFELIISSSSAKIILIMPIVKPLADSVGITYVVVVLCFVLADGYSNVIFPTSPVLLVCLAISEFSYLQWLKQTWFLFLLTFGMCIGLLILSVVIF
jgi:uncharacterized ion transporter superfamily protein YfcC